MMRTHYACEATADLDGKEVKLAGWVHETRDLGALKFVLLRDKSGIVQITLKKGAIDDSLLETAKHFVKETAILCTGVVKASKMASGGREIIPTYLEVVGVVHGKVPFEVTGKVPADLDVRLDKRFIDFRRLETTSVFKIRSTLQQAFREKLWEKGFQEINPPCIVSTSTEGGTDLFPVIYFEKEAFLAQSPQLYKQLSVMGGMDKVFMTSPVFRAEKHNTTAHLNEITQMDIEMGFSTAGDALGVLQEVFLHMLSSVAQKNARDLETLKAPLEIPNEIKRFTYTQVLEEIESAGYPLAWGEDFSKEHEKAMPKILGHEAFIITDWPTKARSFYSMPRDDNPEICHAYDLLYKGVEIASGAQRIHIPELLIKQLKAKGLHPSSFESYIDAFRFGPIPHAGWSIGAERLTQQICNLENIREAALFPRDRTRLTP